MAYHTQCIDLNTARFENHVIFSNQMIYCWMVQYYTQAPSIVVKYNLEYNREIATQTHYIYIIVTLVQMSNFNPNIGTK